MRRSVNHYEIAADGKEKAEVGLTSENQPFLHFGGRFFALL
jgi:hypothetical protein